MSMVTPRTKRGGKEVQGGVVAYWSQCKYFYGTMIFHYILVSLGSYLKIMKIIFRTFISISVK